jgi:NADH:ubiquinone oxidoreductase subunit 6 (subunit J)
LAHDAPATGSFPMSPLRFTEPDVSVNSVHMAYLGLSLTVVGAPLALLGASIRHPWSLSALVVVVVTIVVSLLMTARPEREPAPVRRHARIVCCAALGVLLALTPVLLLAAEARR